jgi:hypothetical protein
MRPTRMLVLALAGLVGLHVFMLAGHGQRHLAPLGMSQMDGHSSASASPSPSPRPLPMPPGGHDDAGMAMTVACLAVLAGLLLLLPGRTGRLVIGRPQLPTAIGPPVRPELLGARTLSLAQLCVSLT